MSKNYSYTDKDIVRFWLKVDKTQDCWIWTSQTRNGYGLFWLNGTVVSAHVFSYVIEHGGTDKVIRHTCDNPPCVNPDHLVEGTYSQNTNDMLMRDRGRSKLTNADVIDMRSREMTDTILSELSEEFDVSVETVRTALNGDTFSHLPAPVYIPRQYGFWKLTREDVTEIKKRLESPYRGINNDLAREYGVSNGLISRMRTGHRH